MALHTDLQNIVANKPAGEYFLYYDRSIVPEVVSASGLRILIGQSRKGIVNALTYHDQYSSFKQMYGDIDRTLERDGAFFHRSAFEMLSSGIPIAAINLRSFDDSLDLTGKIELSARTDKNNQPLKTVPYRSLFDTERFWKVDKKAIVDNAQVEALLSFANVGSSKKTIFVRKAFDANVDGTISEYYSQVLNNEVPPYLYGSDKISDTFIDVFVFDNDFSVLENNQSNPNYGHLFNENGVVRATTGNLSESTDALNQLSSIREAGFVKKYTGSLISDLTDVARKSLSIVNLINSDFATVGLMTGVNEKIIDSASRWTPTVDVNDNVVYASNGGKQVLPIDFVGHNLWSTNAASEIDIASYDGQVTNNMSYDGLVTTKYKEVDYNDIREEDINLSDDITALQIKNGWFVGKHGMSGSDFTYDVENKAKMYLMDIQPINIGDKYVSTDSNLSTLNKLEFKGTTKILIGLHSKLIPLQASGDVFPVDASGKFIYPPAHAQGGSLVEYETVSPFRPLSAPLAESGVAIPKPTQTQVQIDATLALYGTVKNVYLASFDKPLNIGEDAQVTNSTELDEMTITLDNSSELKLYRNTSSLVYRQIEIDELVKSYKPFALKAYKQRKEQFVNNTASRQGEVLNVLSSDLKNAIIDRERVDFRYLVDSFKSYIENNLKGQFTSVIKDRNVGAAILNAPSIDELRNSTNPYFKATTDGKFDSEYIYRGGNTSLPYTQTFSLATKGSNHGYYYAPWFNVDDNGNEIIMPPAPFISNNFIRKSSSGRPYDAVFGADNGVVIGNNIKSLEYDFTDDDRKWLEKSGINPIVFKKSAGNIIMGNRTAAKVNTALKFAHVNELITLIHEQMKPIALFLIGKYNTAQNRLIAKTRMDNVMRPILAQGAIQYYENKVDDKNNTQEVISEGLGVMDTVFVPNYINEKVAHRLIVNRTTEEVTSTIL